MFNESAFCDVLAQLRVSGAVVLSHHYQTPWAIDVPSAADLITMLKVDSQACVVPFHIVTEGWLDYVADKGDTIRVESGQFIICANGNGHALRNGNPTSCYTFDDLMYAEQGQLPCGDNRQKTALLCGAFLLKNTRHNPLINALPDVLLVNATGDQASFSMRQIYLMFVKELQGKTVGREYMLERLLEVMFTESIRDYVSKRSQMTGDWLSAHSDGRISAVLNYIHKHIESKLTVSKLAKVVHMSPSRFAALFKQAVGESPVAYIVNWRMQKAATRLLNSSDSLDAIAEKAGYSSRAAFNHAFSRIYKTSPAAWRKSQKK